MRENPPVDVLFAAFIGYESPKQAESETDPLGDFVAALMSSGLGAVDGWKERGN